MVAQNVQFYDDVDDDVITSQIVWWAALCLDFILSLLCF